MALNVHFGMALLISSFCLQTVTERVSKAKHIQFVSGVYLLTYWLAALLWDLIYFSIICCFILVSVSWNGMNVRFPMSPSGNLYPMNCILKLKKKKKKFETTLVYDAREYIVKTSLWKCSPSCSFHWRKYFTFKSLSWTGFLWNCSALCPGPKPTWKEKGYYYMLLVPC